MLVSQTKAIERYNLGTGAQPTCTFSPTANLALATNYQDLWWAASGTESGWGVNFAHQGDSVFLTWYTYDSGGAPLWLSALTQRQGATNVYTGALLRTSGPRFDNYKASDVVMPIPAVGTATLTFANGNSATFHYTTNGNGGLPAGVDQTKSIVAPRRRQPTSRVYEYDLEAGTAGTYWYHPHPHNRTAEQTVRGLAGPLIVRADDDPLAHLPDVTLFITGLRLDSNADVAADDAVDWSVGRQGEVLLVNGGRLPIHTVRPGTTERWRIVNATSARHFRLALEGHTVTMVGTDGGLLGAPIADLPEVLIGPAQRVEIVVTVSTTPDARYRLRALRVDTDFLGLGQYSDDDLLTLATTSEPPAAAAFVPTSLRAIGDLGEPIAHQFVELSEAKGICTRNGSTIAFLLNGKLFDPDRIDLVTTVGRVELWDIFNHTGMIHPFHIHGTQFQLVSRKVGAQVIPASYLAWSDTVVVSPREVATIKVRQTKAGKRMFHCHILEHEDACMMGVLDVLPA